jgi:hypothetical protein
MALTLRPGRRSAWWQLHPSGQDRLDLLAEPARLFEISSDLPFLVGVLVAWTIAGVTLILPTAMAAVQAVGSIYPGLSGLVIPLQVMTVVIGFGAAAYLLAASLGQQVQRKTMVEALNRQKGLGPYIRLLMPALLLGAGMEAGYWVVPFGDVTTESWPGAGVSILFLLIASGLSWLGLVYARFTALQILGRRSGHSRPKWSLRFLNLGLTLVFGLLYLYFETWHFCNVYTIETAGNDLCDATSAMGLGAIGIYIVLFLATSLFIAVKHLVAPPRCPHCGARLPSRILIGTIHSACRGSLSEWLFIPDRAPAEPEAPEERAGLPMTAEV